jgi:hypothetical protein
MSCETARIVANADAAQSAAAIVTIVFFIMPPFPFYAYDLNWKQHKQLLKQLLHGVRANTPALPSSRRACCGVKKLFSPVVNVVFKMIQFLNE